VRFVRESGGSIVLKLGEFEFTAPREAITDDPDLARQAEAAYSSQHRWSGWLTAAFYHALSPVRGSWSQRPKLQASGLCSSESRLIAYRLAAARS